jgi:paraquat-inducible protein A
MQGADQATCATCGGLLLRACPSVQHLLALSLSAAVCFIIANVFPVIGITMNGRTVTTTLWGSALSLADHATAPIAIVVALALVVAPAMQIALLCWVLPFALAGRPAPLLNTLMRLWSTLEPWSMVEVGVLGGLVAVVRLKGLLNVHVDVGMWATAALAVLLTAITHWDSRSLWGQLTGGRA